MLRISLIGPGNFEHYESIIGINMKSLKHHIKNLAKILAENQIELELLPSEGIALEIAKEYKKQNGPRVIGTLPKQDPHYGTKHIQKFINEKIHDQPLFNEFINTKTWQQQNRLKALFGDILLYLGSSPGSDLELNYGIYLSKIIKGFKKGINAQNLHPELKAHSKVPYTILVYSPFLANKKIPPETEAYIKKYKINLQHISSPKQLEIELNKINNQFS